MVARLGAMETNFIKNVNSSCTKLDMPLKKSLDSLCCNAGFFPNDIQQAFHYAQIMHESMEQVDISGISNWIMEDYLLRKYSKCNRFTFISGIEPFWVEKPWTRALKGKKVLVIHLFALTIQKQYQMHRKQIFESEELLPEFELKTLKAVQTIAGNHDERFKTWFEALDFMYEETLKIDFDVAIIGCGAYGYPLAAKLKQAGKIAIHMGGVTQIMFGIKGERWENREDYKKLMNDYWVKPDVIERPENFSAIERGCYW